jgi:hypothetical protein
MEYGNSFVGYSATLKDSIITTQKMDNIFTTYKCSNVEYTYFF